MWIVGGRPASAARFQSVYVCGAAVRRKSVSVRFLPVREARSQSVFCPLEGRRGLGGAVIRKRMKRCGIIRATVKTM